MRKQVWSGMRTRNSDNIGTNQEDVVNAVVLLHTLTQKQRAHLIYLKVLKTVYHSANDLKCYFHTSIQCVDVSLRMG